jgi:hypothetical protein
MSAEIVQHALDPMIMNEALHSLSRAKTVAVGSGGAVVAGIALAARMRSNNQEGIVKDGRARFVDQGWIGLRERNRQFYSLTPVYDPFAQISQPEVDPNIDIANTSGPAGKPIALSSRDKAKLAFDIHDLFDPEAEPMYWEKEYFDLLLPGFMLALHPWRKYKLLNTQNDNRAFVFKDIHVPDNTGRLHNIGGGFTWGHITGVDENRQLRRYEYLNDSVTHRAGPVCVEQLVLNGIMASKGSGATDVGDQIRTLIEPVVYEKLYGAEDPVAKARTLFDDVQRETHDALLDLGSELRVVAPIVSPNIIGHWAIMGADGKPQSQDDLQRARLTLLSQSQQSSVGFTTAAQVEL